MEKSIFYSNELCVWFLLQVKSHMLLHLSSSLVSVIWEYNPKLLPFTWLATAVWLTEIVFITQWALLKCRNPNTSSWMTKHELISNTWSKSLSQCHSPLAPWLLPGPGDTVSSIRQPLILEETGYSPPEARYHPNGCQKRSLQIA